MKDWQSQNRVKSDCKYLVVVVPKYRQRVFFGKRRKQIGEILREFCRQKEIVLNGSAQPDHIHIPSSIPPKFSVALTPVYLNGKKRHSHPPGVVEDEGEPVWTEFLVTRFKPTYIIRNRDTKFTEQFCAILEIDGTEFRPIPPRSPNLNPFAERWVQSVTRE